MKKSFFSLIPCLFLFSLSSARALELPVPKIEKLSNGMEVAWFISDQLPLVDLALILRSGSRDDPDGKTGTAQLLSTVLDKGAGNLSSLALSREIESMGASRTLAATEDTFGVGVHGLALDAKRLLNWLHLVVTRPSLTDEEILKEKARLDDRWNHIGDYGENISNIAFMKGITYGTPYARGLFNTRAEFSKIQPADVRNYFRAVFKPSQALLVVIGRVDPSAFKADVEQTFGKWSPAHQTEPVKSSPKSVISHKFKPRDKTIFLVNRPTLSQAFLQIGFRSPLIQSPDHYALMVANALLADHFGSRLNVLLRDKLGLTYAVESHFNHFKDLGYFTLSSSTRTVTAMSLLKKTLEVLQDMKTGGEAPITDGEVAAAKDFLIGSFPLAMSNLGGVATRWAFGYLHGLGPTYLNEFIPKTQAVKTAEVQKAYDTHFTLDQMIITLAGDSSAIMEGAEGIKVGPIEKLDIKDLY